MKKILINSIVLLIAAPFIAAFAVLGGGFFALYYSLFYMISRIAVAGQKIRGSIFE